MLVFSESYWNEREQICFIKLSLVLVRASDRDLSWAWRIARDMLKGLKSSHYEQVALSMNVYSTQMHFPLTKLGHATELQTQLGSLTPNISSFIEIAYCLLILCWLYFNLWFKVLPGNQSLQYTGLISKMLQFSLTMQNSKALLIFCSILACLSLCT